MMGLRRDFDLLPVDEAFLQDYGLPWETVADGDQWLLIHDFPTSEGYTENKAFAAIRLTTGYPNAALDMVYFFPRLVRVDGKPIGATTGTQKIDGNDFQQWSRHRTTQNPWRAGVDNLGTHIILVEDWLEREFEK